MNTECERVCELLWSLFHLNDEDNRNRMRETSWKWAAIISEIEPWALRQKWITPTPPYNP